MIFLEKSKKSIKIRTTYIIVFILTLSVGASLLINVLQSKSIIERSLKNEIYSPGFFVRNDINDMLKYFDLDKLAGMHEYLNKIIKMNEKLSYCYISDDKKRIIYHNNEDEIGNYIDLDIFDINLNSKEKLFVSVQNYYEVVLPINFQQHIIGHVHMGVRKSIIDNSLINLIYTTVTIFIITLTLSIILLSTFLTKSVINPIYRLSMEMKDMTRRMKFDKTVDVVGEDEIAELAKDFNILINEVNHYSENLEGLVKERTLELEREKVNLEKERTFSNSLLENSPFGIQVLDIEGNIVYTNPASEKISGYKKNQVIGKNWLKYESVTQNEWRNDFKNALKGKTSSQENVLFKSQISGKELLLNIVFTPVTNKKGKVINVLVMYYDNTEKALAEKQLKKVFEELREKDRIISHDLNMAKSIQTTVLEKGPDDINGLDVEIHFEPMIEVGGDIYDIYKINENKFRFFVADSTGHGVQAALTTMIIKSEYDRVKVKKRPPNEILTLLNEAYHDEYRDLYSYFTCALIDIDIKQKKLTYSSGGHPDQYLISGNEIVTLQAGGKLMGVRKNVSFILRNHDLKTHDKLVLFTDGLFEEFSANKGKLSEEEIRKIMKKYTGDNIATFVNNVIGDVKNWLNHENISDDITLIGIQIKE